MVSDEKSNRRHSVAETPDLVSDESLRAQIEASNGLKQFDLGMRIVEDAIERGAEFKWRPSMILSLHREALQGLSAHAGIWRPAGVSIGGSAHEPVGSHLVSEKIEDLCDYLNTHRFDKNPIHLAAYVMWRLNWIHPFSDGNGRTSRVFSYVVLCVALGFPLKGTNTIPDQIVSNRNPYFDALEAADAAFKNSKIDVSQMEKLLERLLAVQLTSIFDKATEEKH